MNRTLWRWIAQSESWQTSVDLHIPKEEQSTYQFLPRYDDFYLNLMSYCIDILNSPNQSVSNEEMLLVAKGLEIFSLNDKRDNFQHIDWQNNMLFAAGLYYLAGYSSSSIILSSLCTNYDIPIDEFISNFLRKSFRSQNEFTQNIWQYLETGNYEILENLLTKIDELNEISFNTNVDIYISSLLAKQLVNVFKSDNIWTDLLSIADNKEFWKPYILRCINKEPAIINFFPSQREALKCGILSEETMSLQMPTSAGKTYLSEIVIYNQIKNVPESKVLYLTPYRALASELKKTLVKRLKSLGINTTIMYGGNLPTIEERNDISLSNVLISTPEKYISIQNILPNLDDDYSIIICDEGHLLDDSSRGLEYELLLSRLRLNKNKKRFVFMSAIIPNLFEINDWLGGSQTSIIKSSYRPTQLDFAFLEKMDNTQYYKLTFNPGKQTSFILNKYLGMQELSLKNISERYKISSKKGITVAVALKAVKQGPVLIFTPHKRGKTGVEGIVEEIIKQLNFINNNVLLDNIDDKIIIDLIEYFSLIFGDNYLLVNAIKNGILFHHGDFPQFIREIIEDLINEEDFKLIACTNTLTEGINLPIKTIVINSTKRYNPEVRGNYEKLNLRELKNLVGRAGRAGKETKGLIIVPHQDDLISIMNVMNETDNDRLNGNLYNRIIRPITKFLIDERIILDDHILAQFEEAYPEVIDSIDISLLELLSEEVGSKELMTIVTNLVASTFSFYQSDEDEKDTLTKIFIHRANALVPYINTEVFKEIKGSGTSISTYEMIDEIFDFDDEIWYSTGNVLSENWLIYLFDNGVFNLDTFKQSIEYFNAKNNVKIEIKTIKIMLIQWMKGAWYHDLSLISGLSVNLVLDLMNTIFQFELQSILSSIIRIAEIKNKDKLISPAIINWTKMFQYGLDTQLKLDILELGLNDRVAILFLEKYCVSRGYSHQSKNELRQYLKTNITQIYKTPSLQIPNMSFNKLINFLDNI